MQKLNLSHPGFEPKTCPLREQAANQLSQSGYIVVIYQAIWWSRADAVYVHLSSNDHLEMGGIISQLLDFKTTSFKISYSPLGIQGLHTTVVSMTDFFCGVNNMVTSNKSTTQKNENWLEVGS